MSQLPQGWSESPISELALVQAGVGFPKKFQGINSEKYPVYKVGDISRAYLNEKALLNKAENYVSEEVAAELKGKIFKEGSILFAKIGEALKLNRRVIVTKEGLADNNVMAVIPKDNVDENYLFRFLQYFDVASLSRSTTVPSIRKGDVENISVPHPDFEDQKRIADKLDSVLAKVEAAQARLDKIPTILKRFRQSVLAAATSGKLTIDWREENDFESPTLDEIESYWKEQFLKQNRKFKSYTSQIDNTDDIGWLPSKLGSICDVHVGSTPKRTEPSYWNGDVKWVSSSEVAFCEIFDTKETITIEGLDNSSTKLHPSGTVMLAMIGQGKTRGQPAILRTEACHNQNTAALRIPEHHLLPEYLYYLLWERYEETRKIGAGNNQKALNKATVQSIDINLPPIDEQKIIVQKVEQLFEQAGTVEKQYNAAKARLGKLTQSILAKAFRGELVK